MSIQTRERTHHFDRQALVELYEEHNNALYRYAYRLLGQQDMAEDCVSEVFTRFLQIVQNGKGPQGNIRAYLYRMTHNCVVDHYRQKRTDVPIENTILKDPRPELEDDLHQKQNQEKLKEVLLKMPEEQRMVIMLRYFEDWSHEQVASHLGKTEEATRALQYRALRSLQKKYANIRK